MNSPEENLALLQRLQEKFYSHIDATRMSFEEWLERLEKYVDTLTFIRDNPDK
jgi:hypothetical protein